MKRIAVSFQREDKLMELASDALLRAAVAELGDGIFEPGDRPHHGDGSRLQARVAVSHDTCVIGWIRATGHTTRSREGEFLYKGEHAFPLLHHEASRSTGAARLWNRTRPQRRGLQPDDVNLRRTCSTHVMALCQLSQCRASSSRPRMNHPA
jgi:hypothetical protein